MTYAAQSCRKEAAINDKFGDPIMNDPDLLRAHADLLDWKARIEAAQGEDVREAVISLKKRAQIRREIPGRKSVELGEPDRIANQLDHAATLLEALSAKLAELEAAIAIHHKGQFCPYCNPCRRAPEITPLETALRSLASFVGNGGFNSPTVNAAEFEAKIRGGINALCAAERDRAEKAKAEVARLKAHAEAMWRSHNAATYDYSGAFPAYRRDYPEGTK